MTKLKFVVSLMTDDNDYQLEQARSAEATAAKLGIEQQILYAENDAVTQSAQLLKMIQVPPEKRPQAIVCEPVGGTAMEAVARGGDGRDWLGGVESRRGLRYRAAADGEGSGLLRELGSFGSRANSSAAVRRAVAQGRNGALSARAFGQFRRQGEIAGHGGKKARESESDYFEGAMDGRECPASGDVVAEAVDVEEDGH